MWKRTPSVLGTWVPLGMSMEKLKVDPGCQMSPSSDGRWGWYKIRQHVFDRNSVVCIGVDGRVARPQRMTDRRDPNSAGRRSALYKPPSR